MKRNVVTIFLSLFVLSSCQITQYHTAKTLDKGEKQIVLGFDSQTRPVFSSDYKNGAGFIYSLPIIPSLHLTWGTKSIFDHTLAYSPESGFMYATKIQFIGDNQSHFSAAFRPEIGIQPIGNVYRELDAQGWLKTPFIFTYEFGKKSSLTYSPGLIFSLPGYTYNLGLPNEGNQTKMFSHALSYHVGSKNRFVVSIASASTKDQFINSQLSVGYIWKINKKKKEAQGGSFN